MAHHVHIHVHDAFEESKHPRGPGGRFGSQSAQSKQSAGKHRVQFRKYFMTGHPREELHYAASEEHNDAHRNWNEAGKHPVGSAQEAHHVKKAKEHTAKAAGHEKELSGLGYRPRG